MKNLTKKNIEIVKSNFEHKTRDNGESFYAYMKDDSFKDLIYHLHDGKLPNDFIFEFCHDAIIALRESESLSYDSDEYLNSYANNYTLIKWYSDFMGEFEDFRDELGFDSTTDVIDMLASGYCEHQRQVFNRVVDYFEELENEENKL